MWEEGKNNTGDINNSGQHSTQQEDIAAPTRQPPFHEAAYKAVQNDRQYSPWESRYQWQPPVEPNNRTPWEENQRQSKKRRNRGPTLLIIALAIIIGIAFVVRFSLKNAGNWPMGNNNYSSNPSITAPIPYDDPQTPTESTTVERAPIGDGTALRIENQTGDPLVVQDVYRQVSPSVVSIIGNLTNGTSYATGIVMSDNGYIVTNYHVIEGSNSITVVLQNNDEYSAKLVGGDAQTDLAVLKIEASTLTVAKFGDSNALVVGDSVYAIGNPLGIELKGTLTDGIISAINRDIYVDGRTMTLLQTNAALNNGNSGGPLINVYGQIVGINTIKMSSYYSTIEGLGFAIPISSAKPIIDELIAIGYISGRSAIGITASTLTETAAAFYSTVQGVYVETVDIHSDAYQSGIRPGDIIVKIDGKDVLTLDDVYAAKETFGVGDSITITVYRDGSYIDFNVILMDAAVFSGETNR